MTYQEFCATGFTIDKAAFYAAAEQATDKDIKNALKHYVARYAIIDALRTLSRSKAANKPIHYKVVSTAIKSCNDDMIRLYVANDWYAKKLVCSYDYNYEFEGLYLNVNDDNTIEWDNPTNCEIEPYSIDEIIAIVQKAIQANDDLKRAIDAAKKTNSAIISECGGVIVPRLWVEVKG